MDQYKVVVAHGETNSLAYVVRFNPSNEEEWEIVSSYSMNEWASEFVQKAMETMQSIKIMGQPIPTTRVML